MTAVRLLLIQKSNVHKIVMMDVLPDEEVADYLCLWDGAEEEDKDNLIGYYLYKVSKHGLIYKEED
jgi:hypothetical protein